jgi:putative addiction module CopG family antidote
MVAPTLPPDLDQFVAEQIATGRYRSPEELMVDAVRVLRQLDAQQQAFHDDVREGMNQLARGEYTEYDDAGLDELFAGLKQRALARGNADEGRK